MTYQSHPQRRPDHDAAPNIATLAEIQFAEKLRHGLELRLLSATDTRTLLPDAADALRRDTSGVASIRQGPFRAGFEDDR